MDPTARRCCYGLTCNQQCVTGRAADYSLLTFRSWPWIRGGVCAEWISRFWYTKKGRDHSIFPGQWLHLLCSSAGQRHLCSGVLQGHHLIPRLTWWLRQDTVLWILVHVQLLSNFTKVFHRSAFCSSLSPCAFLQIRPLLMGFFYIQV